MVTKTKLGTRGKTKRRLKDVAQDNPAGPAEHLNARHAAHMNQIVALVRWHYSRRSKLLLFDGVSSQLQLGIRMAHLTYRM